jgi:hypothetical protein
VQRNLYAPSALGLLLALAACQREGASQANIHVFRESPEVVSEASRPRVHVARVLPPKDLSQALTPGTLCNLEGMGEAIFAADALPVRRGAPVLIRGWVGIEPARVAPKWAALRMFPQTEGNAPWQIDLPLNARREDVANAQSAPGMVGSGFDVGVDLGLLPPGNYRLLIVYGDGEKAYSCDNGRMIEVLK